MLSVQLGFWGSVRILLLDPLVAKYVHRLSIENRKEKSIKPMGGATCCEIQSAPMVLCDTKLKRALPRESIGGEGFGDNRDSGRDPWRKAGSFGEKSKISKISTISVLTGFRLRREGVSLTGLPVLCLCLAAGEKGLRPAGRGVMSSTLRAARQVSGWARLSSLLQALANTQRCCVKLAAPPSTRGPEHELDRTALITATYSTFASINSGSSIAAFSNMPRLTRASPKQQRSLSFGTLRYLPAASSVGPTRMFGGQSVVPWELALFLVEEVQ